MNVYELLCLQEDFVETLNEIKSEILDITDGTAPVYINNTDVLAIIDKRIKEIESESRRILGQ